MPLVERNWSRDSPRASRKTLALKLIANELRRREANRHVLAPSSLIRQNSFGKLAAPLDSSGESVLKKLFDLLDVEEQGELHQSNFNRKLLKSLAQEQLSEMLQEMIERERRVSFSAFVEYLGKNGLTAEVLRLIHQFL